MWVYIVVYECAYGTQIDKVFTSQHKADNYVKGCNEVMPNVPHRVEAYFAT